MKQSAVDILLISMNLIFKSMSHPKQPARAQATVHKTMISLSNYEGLPQNFYIKDPIPFQVEKYEICLYFSTNRYNLTHFSANHLGTANFYKV